jgi:uncharacterized Zn finger protein
MEEPEEPALDCHICGEAMRLARVVPKLGPHPELRSFRCGSCGEIRTIVVNGDDNQSTSPNKSNVNGQSGSPDDAGSLWPGEERVRVVCERARGSP